MSNQNFIKIIHTADLHLDSRLSKNLDSSVSSIRKNELLDSFIRLVEYASDNNAEYVLISGDTFDTNRISKKTKDSLFNLFKKYSNINFFFLAGNHDNDVDSLFFNEASVLDNVYVFGKEFKTFDFGSFTISGVELNNNSSLFMKDTLSLPSHKKNILMLHGMINGSGDEAIKLSNYVGKNIDYLALGHIHSFGEFKIDSRGVAVYSGCLEGRGFDEIGKKGFVEITIGEELKYQFVPFSKRVLHLVEFDISGYNSYLNIENDLFKLLDNIPEADMVKVVLCGNYNVDLIKHNELLNSKLSRKFLFGKVYDESRILVNIDDFKNEKSLKGEFIRLVYDSNLSDDLKNSIIECGIDVLTGGDK